ncbi:MAG: YdcF family protein [Bryobacteraceae bacterium]|jgi:uncharacterized SAM-binding protein YcdF (DUF218 family)
MARKRQIAGMAALLVAAGLAVAVVPTAVRIQRQSTRDESRPADVILILGAAEYRGKPSPVLKGRLDHGLDLYRRKQAPLILTTGGAGGDPVFTEGEVSRDYLVGQGVPSEAILVESEGATTMHSIAAAGEIMRRMSLRSCIVVSDGYHIYRAKRMLQAQGFRVYGSPRPEHASSGPRQWWLCVRQAVGYWLWRVGIKV